MNYDTFQTVSHRGVYIHIRHNRAIGREEFTVNSPINGHAQEFRTLHAAKLACSRIVRAIANGHPVAYPHHGCAA